MAAASSESENDHKGTSSSKKLFHKLTQFTNLHLIEITPPDQTRNNTKKADEKHSVSNNDKNKSSKSSSHSSDKHRKTKSNEHTSSSSSTSKKRSHDEANHQPKEKLAENESKKMKTENVKSTSSSSNKDQSKSHKSSSSSTNGHHKHHKKDSKKDNKKEISVEKPKEFDDSQGIGFAEALAFFDMPSSSSKHHKKEQMAAKVVTTKSIPSAPIKPVILSKPPERKKSRSPPFFRPIYKLTDPPKLLTQKPKIDLLSDIASDLSVVSLADYRPLPLNSAMKEYINSNVHGSSSSSSRHAGSKPMNASEMFDSFTSRENRTRVYSGNAKARGAVPTLKSFCVKAVADNIDLLEYTGGVPYEILEPVLKQAKPDQLTNVEYYNPYLLKHSDVLWKPHCIKKWKNKKPQEMETWRDMYERCTQEDEDKLNRLTNLIKHNQEVTSNGIQKTKMAFVDTMVKPPRNMMRKQEQYGTNHKLVVSAAARVDSLKRLIPNIAKPGDVRLRVAAGLRDDAQQGKFYLILP